MTNYTVFDETLGTTPALTREGYYRQRAEEDRVRAVLEAERSLLDAVFGAVGEVTGVSRKALAQRGGGYTRSAPTRVLRARRLACRLLLDHGMHHGRVQLLTGSRNATVQARNADPVLLERCKALL